MGRLTVGTALLAIALALAAAGENPDLALLRDGELEVKRAALKRLAKSAGIEEFRQLLALASRLDLRLGRDLLWALISLGGSLPPDEVVDCVLAAPEASRQFSIPVIGGLVNSAAELIRERVGKPGGAALAVFVGSTGTEASRDLLLQVFKELPAGERTPPLCGLARMRGRANEIAPVLLKAWPDATSEERTAFLRAAVWLKGGHTLGWLIKAARTEDLALLVPVFDPAYRPDVLEGLLHYLPKTLDPLIRLTGKDFGFEVEAWRKWIRFQGTAYEPREGVLPTEPGEVVAAPNAPGHFYGVPLPKTDFVFLIDASASMVHAQEGEERPIDLVKARVLELIEELPAERRFGVVFFHERAKSFRSKLVTATPENKRHIVKYIEAIRAGGGTNYEAGLKAALRDRSVNDILLLSDGHPTCGRVIRIEHVLALLGEREVRIHTIGRTLGNTLLGRIAKATGGSRGVF